MSTTVIQDVPKQLFISGAWQDAESGRTLAVDNPATGQELCQVADASPAEAQRATRTLRSGRVHDGLDRSLGHEFGPCASAEPHGGRPDMAWIEHTSGQHWRVRYRRADGTVTSEGGFITPTTAHARAQEIDVDQHRGTFYTR